MHIVYNFIFYAILCYDGTCTPFNDMWVDLSAMLLDLNLWYGMKYFNENLNDMVCYGTCMLKYVKIWIRTLPFAGKFLKLKVNLK